MRRRVAKEARLDAGRVGRRLFRAMPAKQRAGVVREYKRKLAARKAEAAAKKRAAEARA